MHIRCGSSAVLYMALFMDVPMIIIGQQMLKGVDSFTLMAIPFFVIAGGLMESGGISKRIVNFARTVVGHCPGGLAIVTVVASMICSWRQEPGSDYRGSGRNRDSIHAGGRV